MPQMYVKLIVKVPSIGFLVYCCCVKIWLAPTLGNGIGKYPVAKHPGFALANSVAKDMFVGCPVSLSSLPDIVTDTVLAVKVPSSWIIGQEPLFGLLNIAITFVGLVVWILISLYFN